jgi:hypothetical protein
VVQFSLVGDISEEGAIHMEKDSTATAATDLMGRRLRMVGIALGISYLLMPTITHNLHYLPLSLNMALSGPLWACFFPAGVLALGFLAASLLRPAGRDWRAVDRVFGIFLAIAAAITVVSLLCNWSPSPPRYTETTQRLVVAIWLLGFLLVLSSAGLFFTRYSWAFVPLILLVLMPAVLRLAPIQPDHPELLKLIEQRERSAPFFQAVDEAFWQEYWATRHPEAVAALFVDLPVEAGSALSGFMEEDAVRALLERGDDTAFLQAMPFGARRDEDGAIVHLPTPYTHRRFSVGLDTRHLFFVALAYALIRSLMAMRSFINRRPDPNGAPAA